MQQFKGVRNAILSILAAFTLAALASCDFFDDEPRESWLAADTTRWLYLGLADERLGNVGSDLRLRRFGDYLYAPLAEYGLYRLDLFDGPSGFEYVGHIDTSKVPLDGNSCLGTPCAGAADILISEHHREVILLALYPGLARSSDGGETWTVVEGVTQPVEHIRALRELTDGTIIAGRGWVNSGLGGVIVSTDGGLSWSVATDSLPQCCHSTMTVAGDGQTTAIGGDSGSNFGSWHVYRSEDGLTWVDVSVPHATGDYIQDVVFPDPGNAESMATSLGPVVYRSTNGGDEWVRAHEFTPGPVHLASGESAGRLIAVAEGGSGPPLIFFESVDSGDTWNEIEIIDLDDGVESITYDNEIGRLLVWTVNNGVFAFDPD